MTNTFFNVLRKEKGFITIYSIFSLIMFLIGLYSINDLILAVIGSFTLVTIAHNQYKSIREKIFCVSLAILCMAITMIVGMDVALVTSRLISEIITGFVILTLRNISQIFY